VLEVFIAPPGDVPQEREIVRRVATERTHEVGRHHGWSVSVVGWEQRRPGLGRAQDLINPLVDSCAVLVGILAGRWGTPTGDYTSGFEEEFERVRQRKDDGEQVDALL